MYKVNEDNGYHFISDVKGEIPILKNKFYGRVWFNVADRIMYTTKRVNKITTLVATQFGPKQISDITILSTGWVSVNGLFEYDLENVNIHSGSIVSVIPEITSMDVVGVAEIYTKTVSSEGSLKLYSKNAPTGDIVVSITIF